MLSLATRNHTGRWGEEKVTRGIIPLHRRNELQLRQTGLWLRLTDDITGCAESLQGFW